MSITPLRFTGVSTFSDDFQQILARAVSIASLPIQLLQNQQSDLLSKKQTLSSINSSVSSLESAVESLGELGDNKSLAVSSSNTSRVTVTLNGASSPAAYVISNITSVAKPASENTLVGYADADTAAVDSVDETLTLVFGGDTYELDLSKYGNNLNGLRDAINDLGLGLTATVLNTGDETDPYYLSVSASTPGETTLSILSDGTDPDSGILTTDNQGSNTVFDFNGLTITRPDKVITDVAPGVTFTVLDTTAENENVALTLSSSRSALSTALQNFVSAYNTVNSALNLQIGEGAGLLSGDSTLRQIKNTLRQLVGYNGGGSVASLTDFGIELDKTGVMSFDSTKFYALSSSTLDAGFDFLSTAQSGFGTLAGSLKQIADPVSGLIKTQQDSYDTTDQRITDSIDQIAARIDQMQQSLSLKLQQADVLLNTLQSQQTMLDASLEGVKLATYGKQDQ